MLLALSAITSLSLQFAGSKSCVLEGSYYAYGIKNQFSRFLNILITVCIAIFNLCVNKCFYWCVVVND